MEKNGFAIASLFHVLEKNEAIVSVWSKEIPFRYGYPWNRSYNRELSNLWTEKGT